MKKFIYPAIFSSECGEMKVSIPDLDVTEEPCGNNIADAVSKAERILAEAIKDKLDAKEELPEPYGDVTKFCHHMVIKLTAYIPELRDACSVIVSELAKKEFFYDAMIGTVKTGINDVLNKLDKDTDTLLVDDIAVAVVDRIGGFR